MDYILDIRQKFPKSDSWTFGPYNSLEEAAREAITHCRAVGAVITNSEDFEFRIEDNYIGVSFHYIAKNQPFDEIEGFKITIQRIDKVLGLNARSSIDNYCTLEAFGIPTLQDKLLTELVR